MSPHLIAPLAITVVLLLAGALRLRQHLIGLAQVRRAQETDTFLEMLHRHENQLLDLRVSLINFYGRPFAETVLNEPSAEPNVIALHGALHRARHASGTADFDTAFEHVWDTLLTVLSAGLIVPVTDAADER